jgi:hypothetical protein
MSEPQFGTDSHDLGAADARSSVCPYGSAPATL